MSSQTHENANKKQGAYGQVKIHKHSWKDQLTRPTELYAIYQLLQKKKTLEKQMKVEKLQQNESVNFCYDSLNRTSRSFAMVIQFLPEELKNAVCVFYLVLRALDTIEDETDPAKMPSPARKIELLHGFADKLDDLSHHYTGIGSADEATLVENLPQVTKVLASLRPAYREVIKEIAHDMAYGMAEFVEKDMGQGTKSVKEYDLYCHYVAGLVGEGLSKLFAASGLEDPSIANETELANSMGLFLQKVNIIRDFLEDYVDRRAFWPQEIWKRYANELGELAQPENREQALQCLHDMVENALSHVPDCMNYLGKLRNPQIFIFCAVPQVMAIATLAELYNNPLVFTGVVKIRKGLSARIFNESGSMREVHDWFVHFARIIEKKVDSQENSEKSQQKYIHTTLRQIEEISISSTSVQPQNQMFATATPFAFLIFFSTILYCYVRAKDRGSFLPNMTDLGDVGIVGVGFTMSAFLLSFGMVPYALPSQDPKKKTS